MTSDETPAGREGAAASSSRAVLAATLTSALLIAQQVAGRAIRDGLFLSQFPVRMLPRLALAGAALSLVAVVLTSRAMARWSPARVAPAAFGANAALFVADWLFSAVHPRSAALLLYLHIAFSGATVISIFWSLVSERFDPHSSRKFISRIGAGATAGGIAGGLLAWNASARLGVRATLVVLAAMNLLCLAGALRVSARGRVAADDAPGGADAPAVSPVGALRGSRYLRTLALCVVLVALIEALLDYVLSARAAATHSTGVGLVRFFAMFHTGTALVAFALQAGLARVALRRLGAAGTLSVLPAFVIAGGVLGLQAPALWSAVVLRSGESALSNSLYRSGYELFYAPLPSETKRPTKAIIDVGADRLGTALGSGFLIAAIALGAAGRTRIFVAVAVALAAGVLLVARAMHRGYVGQLEANMKAGEAGLEAARRAESVSQAPQSGVGAGPAGPAISAPPFSAEPRAAFAPALDPGPLVAAAAALLSGDRARAAGALAGGAALDPRLVAHVIPLLADEALRSAATRALRSAAARTTGQLVDALLDPSAPPEVRRAIPAVLRSTPTQRTVDGLVQALGDPSFDVRYQSGLALLRVAEKAADLALPSEALFAAVLREVELGKSTWDTHLERIDEQDEDDEFLLMEAYLRLKTSRGLQYVFALLSAALEHRGVQMAFRALSTEDEGLRGTALEYLATVLPEPVFAALTPYLGDPRAFGAPPASKAESAQRLLESSETIASALAAMRGRHDRARDAAREDAGGEGNGPDGAPPAG